MGCTNYSAPPRETDAGWVAVVVLVEWGWAAEGGGVVDEEGRGTARMGWEVCALGGGDWGSKEERGT